MKKKKSDILGSWFIKVFVLGLSLLFLIPTGYKMYDYIVKRSMAIQSEAIVMTDPIIGSDLACRPMVRYTDHRGNSYEHKSRINFYWILAPQKGDHLTIYYRKDAPDEAFIDNLYYYIVLPLQLFMMGAFLMFSVFTGRV